MPEHVLVVDDEASMREMLKIMLEQEGYMVNTASSAEEASVLLGSIPCDLVLSDIRMPGLSGIELLRKIKDEEMPCETILLTAYSSMESAIEALKLGAFDYVTKPFQVDELLHLVRQALEKKTLREENVVLKAGLSHREKFGEMVGSTRKMREIYALIERVAPTSSTVLICGESGTGKELVARAIHKHSTRSKRPFVAVNCGALPETLLESELFGHAKGSFTGATTTKKGLFDVAAGGTIFLDEIGEMSPTMQVKLLRTLQERRVRAVGATEDHPVDIRVVTATNQDLEALVAERKFREDLFYRVNVIRINLPPLRERREDIPLLAIHCLKNLSAANGNPLPIISKDAMEALENYHWPGNVRQFENVIERALAMSEGGRICKRHLPDIVTGFSEAPGRAGPKLPESGFDLSMAIESIKRDYVREALEIEDGVMSRGAKRLGISFRSMRYLVKKYGLNAKEE